ncbi:uncharacterized [Tachysurus ichikawai]
MAICKPPLPFPLCSSPPSSETQALPAEAEQGQFKLGPWRGDSSIIREPPQHGLSTGSQCHCTLMGTSCGGG